MSSFSKGDNEFVVEFSILFWFFEIILFSLLEVYIVIFKSSLLFSLFLFKLLFLLSLLFVIFSLDLFLFFPNPQNDFVHKKYQGCDIPKSCVIIF